MPFVRLGYIFIRDSFPIDTPERTIINPAADRWKRTNATCRVIETDCDHRNRVSGRTTPYFLTNKQA